MGLFSTWAIRTWEMGDSEVALTAMEGSLRGTFRLTVCGGGVSGDLNVAMRRTIINALDFLQNDRGMNRAVA